MRKYIRYLGITVSPGLRLVVLMFPDWYNLFLLVLFLMSEQFAVRTHHYIAE
jgi:hypothetical protein